MGKNVDYSNLLELHNAGNTSFLQYHRQVDIIINQFVLFNMLTLDSYMHLRLLPCQIILFATG